MINNLEQYTKEIKKSFMQGWSSLSNDEVNLYFETEDVKFEIETRYKYYLNPEHMLHGTGSVASVAHCLEMMY